MYSTEAIVLCVQKKSDTSYLVHLYTRSNGHILCIVYGHKGANKRKMNGVQRNVLTPLSWLDVQIRELPSKNMYVLSTASYHYIPKYIYSDVKRQCLALFISEALYKTLHHPMADENLFQFLTNKIKELDAADSVEYLYTDFLTDLSVQLGYGGEPIDELKEMRSICLL